MKQLPGRRHQSFTRVLADKVYCKYKLCPGWNTPLKTRRAHRTNYECEECTIEKGYDMWLCNTVRDGIAVECHIKYHAGTEFVLKSPPGSSTECSVVSDMTNE